MNVTIETTAARDLFLLDLADPEAGPARRCCIESMTAEAQASGWVLDVPLLPGARGNRWLHCPTCRRPWGLYWGVTEFEPTITVNV